MLLLVNPAAVNAATIVSQTTANTVATGQRVYQSLGSGLTGTVREIDTYEYATTTLQGSFYEINLYECTTGAASLSGGGQSCSLVWGNVNFNDFNVTYGIGQHILVATDTPYTLNASKYYILSTSEWGAGPGNNPHLMPYGSSANIYTNGQCFINTGDAGACVMSDLAFVIKDVANGGSNDSTTRVVDSIPGNGSTISTSSLPTIGGTYFLNQNDFLTDTSAWSLQVTVTWNKIQVNQYGAANSLFKLDYSFPLAVSNQIYSVSTTGPALDPGVYSEKVSIKKNTWGSSVLSFLTFGFYDATVVDTKTFTFTVGTTSPYDVMLYTQDQALQDYYNNATSSSSFTDCLGFHLDKCVYYLFLPPTQDSIEFQQLADQMQHKPPFGYIAVGVNLIGIVSSSSTTTLPVFGGTTTSLFRDTISYALWLLFGFWMFNRIRMWDWQQ